MEFNQDLEGERSPINNPLLLGHDDCEQLFLSSFFSRRVPHAWLLTGTKGIGKATFAYRIARFVLTNNVISSGKDRSLYSDIELVKTPINLNSDINNPICRRIMSGGHPDFLNITRALDEKTGKKKKQITVDEIRKINSFLSLTSAEGGWKVIVIDSIDDLNLNSANALLKILEEPPSNTLILLVCHNLMSILETIRSRCRHIKLNLLEKDILITLIKEYLVDLPMDDTKILSRLSGGSIGKALDLAEGSILEVFNKIETILSTFPKLDMSKVHDLGNILQRDKTGDLFIHAMHFLDNWIESNVKNLAPSELEKSKPWLDIWDKIVDSVNKLKSLNLDQKQVFLNTFVSIKNLTNSSNSGLG